MWADVKEQGHYAAAGAAGRFIPFNFGLAQDFRSSIVALD
jgi:hypothetical protein